jgi:hypothetical protein
MGGTNDSSDKNTCCGAGDPGTVPSPGKLLRRAEAARMLGVSKSTLRRMERDELTPVIGPKNVHLFEEQQIRSLVVTRRTSFGTASSLGDHAADAFALFDANEHPADVVKRLRLDPDLVEMLYAKWAHMRGVIAFSAEGRARLGQIFLQNKVELRSEADILEFIQHWTQAETELLCVQCGVHGSAFCRMCAREWGLKHARAELKMQGAQRL